MSNEKENKEREDETKPVEKRRLTLEAKERSKEEVMVKNLRLAPKRILICLVHNSPKISLIFFITQQDLLYPVFTKRKFYIIKIVSYTS